MDNREGFEKWATDNIVGFSFDKKTGGILSYRVTECAWDVWQAATAHNHDAVIEECIKELPLVRNSLERHLKRGRDFTHNFVLESVESRLRALKTSSAIKIRSLKTNKEG